MDWRRGWNETGWKERSRNEQRKGATKTRPKKRNKNNISKGVDEHKQQTRNGRHKRKTRENDKLRVVLKKRILGGGGKQAKHLSNCRKPSVCINYKSTPFEKHQNCRENGVFFIIIAKQNNGHKQKKGRSPKKNRNKEHNNNPDTNNKETKSPQMQETWVWKGDAMELALKESNKLKKGRKKKEDRTESKRKQNVRFKGFDELPRGSRTAATNNDYSSVFVFVAILVLCAGQIPQLCREPHRFRWLVSVFQVILT